ncbi:hypothetical protein A2U01_0107039, partial [Trifolium medium]|nr:hypothetical protein [Trifolium medium]
RKKKLASQQVNAGGNANVIQRIELAKRPVNERLSPIIEEPKDAEDEGVGDVGDYMEDDDLLDDEPDFDVLVG